MKERRKKTKKKTKKLKGRITVEKKNEEEDQEGKSEFLYIVLFPCLSVIDIERRPAKVSQMRLLPSVI